MNLPNALTILRIFFVPLLVAVLVEENVALQFAGRTITNEWLALAIFSAAAATDLLDGYLARRWRQETTIGTLLDPIADKLLISAALISLVQVQALAGWMAILIIGREFAVSGLRSIAAAEGYTIQASDLGKTKMVCQVVAVSCVMLSLRHPGLRTVGTILMWGVVFFAIASAISYFAKFWGRVDESIKKRRRRELLILERRRQRALLRSQAESRSQRPSRDQRGSSTSIRGAGLGTSGTNIWKPPDVS
jgi:CDP-diacylglycerol---glycerol-3-phosphate 3-phosphatidyltransferase